MSCYADHMLKDYELKVVPLRRTGSDVRVKERTVITMIDYVRLIEETWPTSAVRSKLDILFMFFEDVLGAPKASFPILAVDLFRPDERTEPIALPTPSQAGRGRRMGHHPFHGEAVDGVYMDASLPIWR